MCGRFALNENPRKLAELKQAAELFPNQAVLINTFYSPSSAIAVYTAGRAAMRSM